MRNNVALLFILFFGIYGHQHIYANHIAQSPEIDTLSHSLYSKTRCDKRIQEMDSNQNLARFKKSEISELLHYHRCALLLGKTKKAEKAHDAIKESPLRSNTTWILLAHNYRKSGLRLRELQSIQEARNDYPQDRQIMEMEVAYHLRNHTVEDYKIRIRSKIKAGDPSHYFVMGKLYAEQGKVEHSPQMKNYLYQRAILNLERLLAYNPSHMDGSELLYAMHDSLSSILLNQIVESNNDRELDSLAKIENSFFKEQLLLDKEKQKQENPPIKLGNLYAKLHGWNGDTVLFQIVNRSNRSTRLISKSTPHCQLEGSLTIAANTANHYRLKVLPSASQSEFELTPTLFFSDYEGSISLLISGFVKDISSENIHAFPSTNQGKKSRMKLQIRDQNTGQVVYHAQSQLINSDKDSILLHYGMATIETGKDKIAIHVNATGYRSIQKTIHFSKDLQEVNLYIKPIADEAIVSLPTEKEEKERDTFTNHTGSIVSQFARSTIPSQHIVLMIDVSQSMRRAGYIEEITSGLRVLVPSLRPQDSLTILTFSTTKTVIADHIGAQMVDSLTQALTQIKAQGGTNAKVALKSGFAVAKRYYSPKTKSILVLITDGKLHAPGTPSTWYESFLTKYFRPLGFRLNILLYSDTPSDFTSLARLSGMTGGVTQPALNEDLAEMILRYCIQP